MNLKEYIEQSNRTLNNLGKELNVLHSSFGLQTELGELVDVYKRYYFYKKDIDLVNVKEELGDLLWYLAILYREFEISLNYDPLNIINKDISELNLLKLMINKTNMLINSLNTIELQNSDHIRRVKYFVPKVLEAITDFCNYNKFDISEIMQININKLKARFPQKFTENKAINRDLKLERMVLEA